MAKGYLMWKTLPPLHWDTGSHITRHETSQALEPKVKDVGGKGELIRTSAKSLTTVTAHNKSVFQRRTEPDWTKSTSRLKMILAWETSHREEMAKSRT